MTKSSFKVPNMRMSSFLRNSLLTIAFLIYPACNLLAAPAQLTGIDVSYEDDSVIVAVNCDTVKYFDFHRLSNPARWYIDLEDTIVSPKLKQNKYSVEGELIQSIRLSQNSPYVTRLVFDLKEDVKPTVKAESNPPRLLLTWKYKTPAAMENPSTDPDSSLEEPKSDGETTVAGATPFSQPDNTEDAVGTASLEPGTADEKNLPEESPPVTVPTEINETQASNFSPGEERLLANIWPQDNQAIILLCIIMGQLIFLIIITLSMFYLISKGLLIIRQNLHENPEGGLIPKVPSQITGLNPQLQGNTLSMLEEKQDREKELDFQRMQAKIGQLTLENDYLENALSKAKLLSTKQ